MCHRSISIKSSHSILNTNNTTRHFYQTHPQQPLPTTTFPNRNHGREARPSPTSPFTFSPNISQTGPIAAAVVDGKTTVFYVDSSKFLVSLANRVANDGEFVQTDNKRRNNYTDTPLQVNDEDVKSNTKDIAAISYNLPSDQAGAATRARIYYIHPEGYLAELCKNDTNQPWFKGDLDKKKFPAVPDTPVTATWSPGSASIKVVYYRPEQSKKAPYVAW
jgi:hypothetical protein